MTKPTNPVTESERSMTTTGATEAAQRRRPTTRSAATGRCSLDTGGDTQQLPCMAGSGGTATVYGLRATPTSCGSRCAASVSVSGCHCVTYTTPGSIRLNPANRSVTCARVRSVNSETLRE